MTIEGAVFREVAGGLELVGDFNRVYAGDGDPWDQSGSAGPMASYYAESRRRLGGALANHLRGAGNRIEVGCGHGYALDQITIAVRGGNWHGLDISPKAVAVARKRFPEHRFHVGDIRSPKLRVPGSGKFDALILNQVLWYVLERLDETVANCCRLVHRGGIVVVSQAFLRGRQRYGAHIADGFHQTLELLVRRFPELRLIEAHYDDSERHRHHDGLLVFRRLP